MRVFSSFNSIYNRFTMQEETLTTLKNNIQFFLEACRHFLSSSDQFAMMGEEIYQLGESMQPHTHHGLISLKKWRFLLQNNSIIQEFEDAVGSVVFNSIDALLILFSNPLAVIRKREKKLVDYDRFRCHQSSISDLSTLDESLKKSADEYSAINAQLVEELPKFCDLAESFLSTIINELWVLSSRMWWRTLNQKYENVLGVEFSPSTSPPSSSPNPRPHSFVRAFSNPRKSTFLASDSEIIRDFQDSHLLVADEISRFTILENAAVTVGVMQSRGRNSAASSLRNIETSALPNSSVTLAAENTPLSARSRAQSNPLSLYEFRSTTSSHAENKRRESGATELPLIDFSGDDANNSEHLSTTHHKVATKSFSTGALSLLDSQREPMAPPWIETTLLHGSGGVTKQQATSAATPVGKFETPLNIPVYPLFTCTTIYPFSGSHRNQLTVYAGQDLHVLVQEDQWWYCKSTRTFESGWLPSSYCLK